MAKEDDLVDSTQPAEIEEVNIEGDDKSINDDMEVLPVPSIKEPHTIEGVNEYVTNENEHETTESERVSQVNTESEGVFQANNDVEHAILVGTRRSSRVPNSRFRLQTTTEGYELSTIEEEVEVFKNNIMGSKYTLVTQETTKIESKNKSKTWKNSYAHRPHISTH